MKQILFIVFLSVNVWAHPGDFNTFSIFSDSAVFGPKYAEQIENMKALASEKDWIEYVEYGQSPGERPLAALLLTKKNVESQSLTIITGATHGNEYLNIVDRLVPTWAMDSTESVQRYLSQGGAVLVVPILNPDGYDRRVRGNLNRKDLNRDWPTHGKDINEPTQPETLSLYNFVKNYVVLNNLVVDVAVDHHCCVDGMLLLPWGWKKGEYMPSEDQRKSTLLQNMFSASFENPGRIGTPPDLLYSARGTTLDYWYQEYRAISLTYEGNYSHEPELLPSHLAWWDKIFLQLSL